MYTFMCTGKNPKTIFKKMYGGYHGSQFVFYFKLYCISQMK